MPITSSNSFMKAWKLVGVARSYPAAKLWQVSMQIPIREWYSWGIWDIISRNSVSEPPIVVPWAHIVSRTGVTVEVAESAFVSALASREMASERLVWPALPGLWFGLALEENAEVGILSLV